MSFTKGIALLCRDTGDFANSAIAAASAMQHLILLVLCFLLRFLGQ